jgi:hypothetical protein
MLGAGACGPSALTPAEQLKVARWLVCYECVAPLDSVRALAARKPEATVDSLNVALLEGPGASAVAAAESVVVIGYVRDSAWRAARGLPLLTTRSVYVRESDDAYANGYRSRGAIGMGWIHDQRAVAYLNAALGLRLPPTVHAAVLYARDSLPPPGPPPGPLPRAP